MSTGWALLFSTLAAVWLVYGRRGSSGSRAVRGHSHGSSYRRGARHEAGHVAAARALGGSVQSARLDRGGVGEVRAVIPDDPRAAIAFLRAGALAARSRSGACYDDAMIARQLRRVPREHRSQVRAEAEQAARHIVSAQARSIRRDAARLERDGRL